YDANGNGIRTDLGDLIVWNFQVTNTGTVTLDGITVVDPRAGSVTCQALPPGGLQPGEFVLCTSDDTYTVAQADVDAGIVTNTAVAQASTSGSGEPVTSNPSSTDTPILGSPSLVLAKTATVDDLDGNGTDLGDEIGWSFAVTNAGTVTLSEVAVDDPAAGDVTCPDTVLAPGEDVTCTADAPYAVAAADVDTGVVTNTATVSGTAPGGATVSSAPASAEVAVDRSRRLTLIKRAEPRDLDGDGRVTAGDDIGWSFTVTNSGTVTVDDLAVDDPTAGPVTCTAVVLAPGESTTCRTDDERAITAAEAAAGEIRNVATVSGEDPVGSVVLSAEARALVEVVEAVPGSPSPSPTPPGAPGAPPVAAPGGGSGSSGGGASGPLAATGAASVGIFTGVGMTTALVGAWLVLVARRRRHL
ncbi:MAG: DUF7507 domain-containing protein, partial [Dermatophilaceae bacterium]